MEANSFNSYRKSISGKRLTPDQEKKLSKIIMHSKNIENVNKAIDEMVNANLTLVVKIAMNIFNSYHSSLSLMDLVTEGNFWLLYSVRRFSYKKDSKFVTYAYPIIRWNILRYVYANTTIHIPFNLLDYRKRYRALQQKYKGELTNEILMRELDVVGSKADDLNSAFGLKMMSLDYDIGEDENLTLKNVLKDKSAVDPSLDADKSILRDYLNKISNKCLTDREKQVINIMFFEKGETTLKEVSRLLNVTGENIRQIYARAIRKLKLKFLEEWDKERNEDNIDREKLYNEISGGDHFRYAYRTRNPYGRSCRNFLKKLLQEGNAEESKFAEKMLEKQIEKEENKEKDKKIFRDFMHGKTDQE